MLRRPELPARGRLGVDAEHAWESELMRLAERRDGALTVAEVVAHADLEASRAERFGLYEAMRDSRVTTGRIATG